MNPVGYRLIVKHSEVFDECLGNISLWKSRFWSIAQFLLSLLSQNHVISVHLSEPDEGAGQRRHVISAAALRLAADSHPTQLRLFSAEEAAVLVGTISLLYSLNEATRCVYRSRYEQNNVIRVIVVGSRKTKREESWLHEQAWRFLFESDSETV